jgi:uncharacterized protein YceK
MKKVMSLTVVVLLLAGCATAYQREGFTGGFSETQLEAEKGSGSH